MHLINIRVWIGKFYICLEQLEPTKLYRLKSLKGALVVLTHQMVPTTSHPGNFFEPI